MKLRILHPAFADRSCDECEKYLYDEKGYLVTRRGNGNIPLPQVRPAGVPTPCAVCPKIPAGEPTKDRSKAIELTPDNALAFSHYRECKAVGRFPDDPLVSRDAAIIAGVVDAIYDARQDALAKSLGFMEIMRRRG